MVVPRKQELTRFISQVPFKVKHLLERPRAVRARAEAPTEVTDILVDPDVDRCDRDVTQEEPDLLPFFDPVIA